MQIFRPDRIRIVIIGIVELENSVKFVDFPQLIPDALVLWIICFHMINYIRLIYERKTEKYKKDTKKI